MTDLDALTYDFLRDDGGTPLGHGIPSGSPLRADGQSHYEAWQALLRRDPCSYCGARGEAGTVDHVDPRSRAARGVGSVHGWINTVGACGRCNGAKRDLGLLVFLLSRRWSAGDAVASRLLHGGTRGLRTPAPERRPHSPARSLRHPDR